MLRRMNAETQRAAARRSRNPPTDRIMAGQNNERHIPACDWLHMILSCHDSVCLWPLARNSSRPANNFGDCSAEKRSEIGPAAFLCGSPRLCVDSDSVAAGPRRPAVLPQIRPATFPVWFAGLAFLLLSVTSLLAVEEIATDICVYGGTSGGVIAAVQAARMGKSVALIAVNNHLGGMTAGGLGQTDIGSFGDSYIQGVAREFYTRVGQKYGTGAKFTFEPHVAEAIIKIE